MPQSFPYHRTIGAVLCAVVLAASAAAIFYKLTAEPLQDYDEATYTEVVHEALVSHEYFSFTYGGVDYFKKPPLMFWAMLASESILGETLFAERLPFALAALVLIATVMLLVYEVSDDSWAAALSGAVLATTTPFLMTAREVRFDAAVALFITLAFYCALRALTNSRWWILFGIAVGFAVLAKSVIAVFAVIAALVLVALTRRATVFKDKNLYWGVFGGLLVALPWHLYEWATFGNQFWRSYLGEEVFLRTQENLFWTVTITNADYVHFAQLFIWPWLAVFCIAIISTVMVWKWVRPQNRIAVLASFLTIVAMGAVFFISKTKAPTYVIPMYPFMAIAIALSFASFTNKYAYLCAAAVGVALVVLAAQFATYNAYYYNPYFSVVVDMARDEYAIGKTIQSLPKQEPVYVYDDNNLGTIMYYAQHFPLIGFSATSTPAVGSYIIVETLSVPQFAKAFPMLSTEIEYQGPQVTLFKTLSED